MSVDELLLTDEELSEATPAELRRYEAVLTSARAALNGPTAWREHAREDQLPPDGDWTRLFLRGGRGSGKSYAGSRILGEQILGSDEPRQYAVVGPTFGDARDVMVEAPESGLLAALGTSRAEVVAGRSAVVEIWNRSLGELRLKNGSTVVADGADDGALRLQGRSFSAVWADEIGLWRRWEQAWEESIAYALRKGNARLIATGTPKANMPARELVKRLLADPSVIKRRLRTFDNRENLSDAFLAEAEQRVGTRLGRQELEGELLEDVEGALWSRAWIDDNRVDSAPHGGYRSVVVGLDPADGGAQGAEQALTVAAAGLDGELYVIRSEGMRDTPLKWLSRAVRVAREHSASIVIEKNHGGQFLVGLLEQAINEIGVRVPYRVVSASQGKVTRAEPVALLYEQGKVHHIGVHEELEEQQVNFTGGPGETSPDRFDATTWALLEIMGYARRRTHPGAELGAVPYRDTPAPGGALAWAEAPGEVQVSAPGWGAGGWS